MYKGILFLSLLFVGIFNINAQSGLTEAVDFSVKDIYGNNYSLFSILDEGKIVVLPFFTTTCGSCNIYTPEIVLSHQDFGCNEGDVFYLGINYGGDNIAVENFINVHAVGYPCVSGQEGLGNEVDAQYEIVSHITALVITPDRQIVGQFYGPDTYPVRDTINNLLLSLGAEMQDCTTGLEEENFVLSLNNVQCWPNPFKETMNLSFETKSANFYKVRIFGEMGIEIFQEEKYLPEGKQNWEINMKLYPSGLYFVQIQNKEGMMITNTILKQ